MGLLAPHVSCRTDSTQYKYHVDRCCFSLYATNFHIKLVKIDCAKVVFPLSIATYMSTIPIQRTESRDSVLGTESAKSLQNYKCFECGFEKCSEPSSQMHGGDQISNQKINLYNPGSAKRKGTGGGCDGTV